MLVLAALPLAALYVWHAQAYGRWQVDDAGITFAYSRNLAMGFGPVTNPGDVELNEGYSNPAWTWLLAAFIRVGWFDLLWTPKLLSGAFALASLVLSGLIVRRLDDRASVAMLLPAAALIANGSWVAWTIGGLENPQYVACILGALWLYLGDIRALDRWPRSGPLFFLVAISRPEGLLYTLAAGGDAVVRAWRTGSWRWLLKLIAGMAVLWVPYTVAHVAVFDDLLPNTYYAKARDSTTVQRFLDPLSGGWRYLIEGLVRWRQAGLLLLAPLALVDRAQWRRGVGALWLALLGSVAFILQSGGDWMMEYRFASTTFTLLAIAAACGAAALYRVVLTRARGAAFVAGIVSVVMVASALPVGYARMMMAPTAPLEDRLLRLPRLLTILDALHVERKVALMSDMGGPMWQNDDGRILILDMFGLCTREIAHALHDRDVDRMWSYGFSFKPQVVQVPPTLFEAWRLGASPTFAEEFAPLDKWDEAPSEARYFLRRDLIEPAWEDRFAQGDVVVQDRVRVHDVRVESASAAGVSLAVIFSLRGPVGSSPRARVRLLADAPIEQAVTLLDFLPAAGLAPDRVYVAHVTLPGTSAVITGAEAVGTPEPSDLAMPPAWTEQPLPVDAAALIAADPITSDPADLSSTDAGLRFSPVDPAQGHLCTSAVPADAPARIALRLALPDLPDDATLDVRGYDAAGHFVGRANLWRWPKPFAQARDTLLAVHAPEGSVTTRVCLYLPSGGVAHVERWAWHTVAPR
jgi:hypothetical protein